MLFRSMRLAEDKYGGDSDREHPSEGEEGVQPMMTKIKTVLKSEWRTAGSLGSGARRRCFGTV